MLRRSQVLASVSGLSPFVHDALVVYSGGRILPAQIRKGSSCVALLQREMDRARRDRSDERQGEHSPVW